MKAVLSPALAPVLAALSLAPAHAQETMPDMHDMHAGHGMGAGTGSPTGTAPPPAGPPAPPPPQGAVEPAAAPAAGHAADRIWGAEAMRESREALRRENGGQTLSALFVDRFELREHEGRTGYLWDADGWIGGDIDKLWVRTEGEGDWKGKADHAEVQALWSHAVGPWFDLQGGVRQDFAGPDRTSLALGLRGLSPYRFDIDAAAFLSTKGEVTARIEAEGDQRITQRLRLQPRAELRLAAQDARELGVGAGIDRIELGLRLRYEIAREFAPYVGIEQEWRVGRSARFARADGDDASSLNLVTGVRFWF